MSRRSSDHDTDADDATITGKPAIDLGEMRYLRLRALEIITRAADPDREITVHELCFSAQQLLEYISFGIMPRFEVEDVKPNYVGEPAHAGSGHHVGVPKVAGDVDGAADHPSGGEPSDLVGSGA